MLRDQGYSCSVFHPYYSTGYNRSVVYPLLGFEEFKDIYGLKDLHFIRYGDYADDLSTYKNIIDLYENKEEGEKIFNFTVTMQNHNPYDTAGVDNTIFLSDFDSDAYYEINQYLSLIKSSDSAFEYLVNYFSNVEEKTVILMFGDHQPYFVNAYPEVFGIESGSYDERQYITPFIVWANYDISEADIGDISMNYLANVLFDVTGLERSRYFEFLSNLYIRYPVITANTIIDCNGDVVSNSEESSEEYLRFYEFLQYNLLFDDENRLINVFNLESTH